MREGETVKMSQPLMQFTLTSSILHSFDDWLPLLLLLLLLFLLSNWSDLRRMPTTETVCVVCQFGVVCVKEASPYQGKRRKIRERPWSRQISDREERTQQWMAHRPLACRKCLMPGESERENITVFSERMQSTWIRVRLYSNGIFQCLGIAER